MILLKSLALGVLVGGCIVIAAILTAVWVVTRP